jgi:endonuclease/exonuclease/phosphatase family metal-dependent hydrolase
MAVQEAFLLAVLVVQAAVVMEPRVLLVARLPLRDKEMLVVLVTHLGVVAEVAQGLWVAMQQAVAPRVLAALV